MILFLCVLRTILAAIHFNYNLKREAKVDKDGNKVFYVKYPKFKEGEATVREAKVPSNYGTYHIKKPLLKCHEMSALANLFK